MKSVYKVVVSDIKGETKYLPATLSTKFRKFERASAIAKRRHAENRDVTIVEMNANGIVATWEIEAGSDMVVFNG